jgi:hypothetical protein
MITVRGAERDARLLVAKLEEGVKILSGGIPRNPFFSSSAKVEGIFAASGDAKNAPPSSRLARFRVSMEPICCPAPRAQRK